MFTRITKFERHLIAYYRQKEHLNIRQIAKELNRSPSTISREIRRNMSSLGTYCARTAHERYNGRKLRCHKKPTYNAKDWAKISSYVKEDWSPEQVSLIFESKKILNISFQTIYKFIWKDKANGGDLYTHLRQSSKQRRKVNGSSDSRGRIKDKRPLNERTNGATNRSRIGHFEIDLVVSQKSKHCILTLVDRKTRFTIIKKLINKKMITVSNALIKIIRDWNIKSITADNGTEWHDFKRVEKRTGIKFYFCKPYCSGERGTNENTNGLIRQYIPKRSCMKNLTQWECNAIANKLNRRPRKILNLDTPESCHLGIPLVLRF